MTTERLDAIEKVRKFLSSKCKGIQAFNTHNIVGDHMTNIYCEDGITIDYCFYYGYIEIFGLTEAEYRSLFDIVDVC